MFFKRKTSQQDIFQKKPCCLCGKKLKGKIVGDAWGNWAHSNHTTLRCSSCERFISQKTSLNGYTYSDGRIVCGKCTKKAILNSIQVQTSKREVLEILKKHGFENIPPNIQIQMTPLSSQTIQGETKKVSGMTFTQHHFQNDQLLKRSHQIQILFGLPKLEFEATLAHEFLHVWQHENGVLLGKMESEGLCELAAYLIYKLSKVETEFAKIKMAQMEKNPDPIYGKGFRFMHDQAKKLGLSGLQKKLLPKEKRENKVEKKGFFQNLKAKLFPF